MDEEKLQRYMIRCRTYRGSSHARGIHLPLAIATGLICVATLSAQPYTDVLTIQHQYHAPTQYKQDSMGKRSLHHFAADVLMPISLKNGSYILGGGQYSDFRFRTEGTTSSDSIYRYGVFELRCGALYQWRSAKDKTLLLAIPKWSSDKPLLRSEAFQMGFVMLHTHIVNEDFSYKFGLYYNREFFGNYFVPLIGLEWQIKDDLLLYGVLPGNLQLYKTFSPALSVTLSYLSPSGSFLSGSDGNYIRIAEDLPPYVILSAELNWLVREPLVLKLSVGHSFWRHFGEYDQSDIPVSSDDFSDYRDGILLKAGVVVRISEM
jgi:hypothetical protein